jgi:hypothetical protein
MAAKYDIEIVQGETFNRTIRWEQKPYVYKAITAISRAAGMVVTATSHGMPDGWRAFILSAGGMVEANSKHEPPWPTDFRTGTVLTPNTVEFNDVNSSEYTEYTSGGFLGYLTPASLDGFTARMSIKNRVGGTELLSLTTENARIALDDSAKTITLTIDADDTAAFEWSRGVYDLEMVSDAGVVTALLKGVVKIVSEVTT